MIEFDCLLLFLFLFQGGFVVGERVKAFSEVIGSIHKMITDSAKHEEDSEEFWI